VIEKTALQYVIRILSKQGGENVTETSNNLHSISISAALLRRPEPVCRRLSLPIGKLSADSQFYDDCPRTDLIVWLLF
jgi:hypothetical protein